MSNIKINDVPQRIQYLAANGQTQFSIPFPFFENSDIYVWQNGIQIFQGGGPFQYGVTGAGSPSGGLITLTFPANLNDIVTIVGQMPIDRTSIYSATISNLTGSDLNGDFNREVVMLQQQYTTQAYMQLQYAPWAVISQDITVTRDRYIPILAPNQVWRMNDTGTEIEAFTVNGPLAPNDGAYLVYEDEPELANSQNLGALSSGMLKQTVSFGSAALAIAELDNDYYGPGMTGYLQAPAGVKDVNGDIVMTWGARLPSPTNYFSFYNGKTGTANGPLISVHSATDTDADLTIETLGTGSLWIFSDGLAPLKFASGTANQNLSVFSFHDVAGIFDYDFRPQNGTVAFLEDFPTVAVTSVQGTEDQIYVNGSFATPEVGDITLTLPQDINTSSIPTFAGLKIPSIFDSSGNLIAQFTALPGATRAINIGSTDSLGAPFLIPYGVDTDIPITIASKGLADITFISEAITSPITFHTGTGFQHITTFEFANTPATRNVTFPDASGTVVFTSSLGTMASQNANAVAITGGTAALTSGQVAAAPSNATDIVNKQALDTAILNVNSFTTRVATTANLSAIYSNGSSGVGATLTATANGAASIDGVSLSVNDRVLFKNQSSSFQNGIYYLSTNGTGGTPSIFTRATDYDQATEIQAGDLVSVVAGTQNANSAWQQTATVATIGTDPITFTIFTQYGKLPQPFFVGGTQVNSDATELNLLDGLTLVPINKVVTQIFTANGTYTPTAGMKYCYVTACAGGGGSGGTTGGVGTVGASGGGGGGATAYAVFTAATIGASQSVTIGAAGAAGASGLNAGGNGGTTSLGALLSVGGGVGGSGSGAIAGTGVINGGSGGGVITLPSDGLSGGSGTGMPGVILNGAGPSGYAGVGSSSRLGGGGQAAYSGNNVGSSGGGYGSGAGGSLSTTVSQTGAAGSQGVIYIVEYCSA